MIDFFKTIVYEPLHNGLFWILSFVPGSDLGIAVVVLTIIVKVVLLLISHRSLETSRKLQEIRPELEKASKNAKTREERAQVLMELYKKHNINPLAGLGGVAAILIQIPIIISLYFVFLKGIGSLNGNESGIVDTSLLDTSVFYASTPIPNMIQTHFLGAIDLVGHSIGIAILVGITQYFLAQYIFPTPPKEQQEEESKNPTFQNDLKKSFRTQFRYVLPIMMTVVAYTLSAAVGLYFLTSNIVSLLYETWKRRERSAEQPSS